MNETRTATGGGAPGAFAPGWAPVAPTARGRAACRLAEFQDAWAELAAEDRAWFAHWLNELLIDAVLPETVPPHRRPPEGTPPS